MPEQPTESVPKSVEPAYLAIIELTDAVCGTQLNADYAALSRKLGTTENSKDQQATFEQIRKIDLAGLCCGAFSLLYPIFYRGRTMAATDSDQFSIGCSRLDITANPVQPMLQSIMPHQ